MARSKACRSKVGVAPPPGPWLGLDEPARPAVPPKAYGPVATGPVRVEEVLVPAPAPPAPAGAAVFRLAVDELGWLVAGQIPGRGPVEFTGDQAPEVLHGPWVLCAIKAMREVVEAHFMDPVEIWIANPTVVGFLRVTLPSHDRACANFRGHEDYERTRKVPYPRAYREFMLLYLQVKPRIVWV